MLNDGRQELSCIHFDLLGDFNFTGAREQLVGTHAAQIGAQRILGQARAFFRREHGGSVFFADVFVVAHRLVHQDVVFARRRFKHLNRQTQQLFGDFAQRLFVAHDIVRQMVVDFGHGHPTALAAEANQRAVAVGHMVFGIARCVDTVGHTIEFFKFRKIFTALFIGVHIEIDHLVVTDVVHVVFLCSCLAAGLTTRFGLGLVFAGDLGLLGALTRLLGRRSRHLFNQIIAHDDHIAAHLDCRRVRNPFNGGKIGKNDVSDSVFGFFCHN